MGLSNIKQEIEKLHNELCKCGVASDEAANTAIEQAMANLNLSGEESDFDQFGRDMGGRWNDSLAARDKATEKMDELMDDPARFKAWLDVNFGVDEEEEAAAKALEFATDFVRSGLMDGRLLQEADKVHLVTDIDGVDRVEVVTRDTDGSVKKMQLLTQQELVTMMTDFGAATVELAKAST